MILQILQRDGDGPFELRIVALTPGGGVELDFDVRRDAAIFHVELTGIGIEKTPAGRSDSAAIDQRRITANADQAAPGARADERASAEALEHPG